MSAAQSMQGINSISDAQPEPIPASPTPINPDPTQADLHRRSEIDRAWSVYRGEFPEVFKTPHGQTSDNVRPNRCAAIVDKGVSWLFGKEIKLHVMDADAQDSDTSDAAAAKSDAANAAKYEKMEAALARIWGSTDDMLTTLTAAAMNGGVAGHTFVKIVWDSERMKFPRLSVLDSHNVYVLSDPDDVNRAVCYVIEYSAKLGLVSDGQQKTVTKRQVIALVDPDGNARYEAGGEDEDDYWTITNWQRTDLTSPNATSSSLSSQQSNWRMVGEIRQWPYSFPPIVDAMNLPNPNEFWGLSDLPPALIDLNERIHFVESNIAKIIKSNAHPWLFASGCDPSAIRNEPGVVQGLPSTESKVWAVSASGDLAASMAFANDLRADMDEQSRVPAIALGRQESLPRGNMSGIALQLLFQPLIEKTELKRRLYGQLIRRASAYCLVLLGLIQDWRAIEIDLDWANLLPNDDLQMAQTAQTLLQVGYSQTTMIERTGGDPDTEAQNKLDEQQQQMLAFAHGAGTPPMDANALAASAQMTGPDSASPQSQKQQQQPQERAGKPAAASPPPRQPINPNHPAAQLARAKMKAAFGKPVS